MVLFLPFSKQSLFWHLFTLNIIVINSMLTKECEFFQMFPFLVLTLKMDCFQNAPFSNLWVFLSVFEKLRFQSGAMWTQRKNGYVLLRCHMKTEQCERARRRGRPKDNRARMFPLNIYLPYFLLCFDFNSCLELNVLMGLIALSYSNITPLRSYVFICLRRIKDFKQQAIRKWFFLWFPVWNLFLWRRTKHRKRELELDGQTAKRLGQLKTKFRWCKREQRSRQRK